MKTLKYLCLIAASLFCFASARADTAAQKGKNGVDVIMFYYPHWHVYPLGESHKGKNWTEWEDVKTAVPRYAGHYQPIVPTAGYLDSSNPKDVAKEIDLAANHGVDVFLYDWYWHSGVRSMEQGLEKGFLKAKNKDRLKFALMWANHARKDQFRPKFGEPREVWNDMCYSEEDFKNMVQYCIEHYFKELNYYKKNGKIFFSIYRAKDFMDSLGGAQKVKKLFAEADETMKKAGLPPIHWNAITRSSQDAKLFAEAGFESTSAYNLTLAGVKNFEERFKEGESLFEYSEVADGHRRLWKDMSENSTLPNMPIVTRGWDSSPRCRPDVKFPFKAMEYPYTPIVVNSTSDKFETLLRDARDFAAADPKKPSAIFINAWNEYTEGSYMMPDSRNQMESLQAMANVFGRTPKGEMSIVVPAGKEFVSGFPAPKFEDVAYGEHRKQRMHVWLAESAKPTPVVLFLHGGGWTGGGRMDLRSIQMIPEFIKNGISVASVEYRWIQDANQDGINPPVKAPLEDAARAVQFVRSKAKEWNIDPSRIALMGGSAGACSSLWVALSPDMANPNSPDPVSRESTRVKVVSVMVPQTSLDPAQMREWIPNSKYGAHAFGAGSFDKWLAEREKYLPEINKYSPYAIMSKGNPTLFFLSYPTKAEVGKEQKDPTHASAFGVMFKKKCDELGIKCDVKYGEKDLKSNLDFVIKNL